MGRHPAHEGRRRHSLRRGDGARLAASRLRLFGGGQAEEEEALAVQKARVERLVPAIDHANQQTGTLDERIKEIEGEIDEAVRAAVIAFERRISFTRSCSKYSASWVSLPSN